ncbi:MAG: outer membrane beta-barrel protein [Gemmatimonadales bacterium]
MRGLSTSVAAIALGLLLSAPAAHAQGAEFSIGGGVGVPLGDFDDAAKLGWQGTAAVSFVPRNAPIGFQVDGSYSQFSDDSPLDIKSQFIYGTANAVYKFATAEDTRFRPYLIGGGGVYNLKPTGDDVIGDPGSETKFGINAGAGFDIKAGGAGLFLEGRFHNIFTEGSNTQFIPLTVGIRLGGS